MQRNILAGNGAELIGSCLVGSSATSAIFGLKLKQHTQWTCEEFRNFGHWK